ncbi:MAG: acetyl-CoA carboxylase biotin carboxyl carrier protein [Planctomycetota bacterium]|jgi:acetyl-CoA carboxylase biotin carboxyl carrier protein
METLQLIQDTVDGKRVLRAPGVGTFTAALIRGRLLRAGDEAGVLETLGHCCRLVVPIGVSGRVENAAPALVFQPVSYGDVLYELSAISGADEVEETTTVAQQVGGPVLCAPYSGRFWHRPAPGDPAFIEVGDSVKAGSTVGLLEVMKTFTHLAYPSDGSLPSPAKIVRILVEDGGEIGAGDPVIEIE